MSGMQIEGFDELEKLIAELGKVPQKVATKAAKAGAQVDLKATKKDAPDDTGLLKNALTLVGERANQGKKVYEITFDKRYSGDGEDGLVKISKITGNRAYYPSSLEFGWKYHNGGYHIGDQFMKNAAKDNSLIVQQKIIDVAKNELNKILSQAR